MTSEQQRNAQIIRQVGAQIGASPKVVKAALEAGLVETGLRNLPYGDRDSVGVFQQRPSQGWTGLTNVHRAAAEFFQHAIPLRGSYATAGELAQAVQRSDFPGRYQARSGEADALLRRLNGGQSAGASASVFPVASVQAGAQGQGSFDAGAGGDQTALLSALLSRKPEPAPVSVPAPAFAQNRYLNVGQTPSFNAPQQSQAPDVGALLGALGGLGTDLPGVDPGSLPSVTVKQSHGNAQPQGQGLLGEVRLAAGANRAGASLTPGILKIVREVAGAAHEPLTIGTGTAHDKHTINGSISDHSSGNAADIPAQGNALIKLGQDALIAAGMPVTQARKQTGGLFNVPYGQHRRIQIIFNTDGPGVGDHRDHLHVGVTPR